MKVIVVHAKTFSRPTQPGINTLKREMVQSTGGQITVEYCEWGGGKHDSLVYAIFPQVYVLKEALFQYACCFLLVE